MAFSTSEGSISGGNGSAIKLRGHVDLEREALAHAHLQDGEVGAHQLDLLAHGRDRLAHLRQRVAQVLDQVPGHLVGARRVHLGQRLHARERVVEEVRLHLRLQRRRAWPRSPAGSCGGTRPPCASRRPRVGEARERSTKNLVDHREDEERQQDQDQRRADADAIHVAGHVAADLRRDLGRQRRPRAAPAGAGSARGAPRHPRRRRRQAGAWAATGRSRCRSSACRPCPGRWRCGARFAASAIAATSRSRSAFGAALQRFLERPCARRSSGSRAPSAAASASRCALRTASRVAARRPRAPPRAPRAWRAAPRRRPRAARCGPPRGPASASSSSARRSGSVVRASMPRSTPRPTSMAFSAKVLSTSRLMARDSSAVGAVVAVLEDVVGRDEDGQRRRRWPGRRGAAPTRECGGGRSDTDFMG